MILSRHFDLHVYEISKLFQVSKRLKRGCQHPSHKLINFTSDMILPRYFDLHVYEISKLFQVAKDFIFSVANFYKIF